MQSAIKAELQQSRELLRFLLPLYNCHFCLRPLMKGDEEETFGHRRHSALGVRITIHHLDEDRNNNRRENLRLSHTSCHKAYHIRLNHERRKNVQPGSTNVS